MSAGEVRPSSYEVEEPFPFCSVLRHECLRDEEENLVVLERPPIA